jgi:hypothetical protein
LPLFTAPEGLQEFFQRVPNLPDEEMKKEQVRISEVIAVDS